MIIVFVLKHACPIWERIDYINFDFKTRVRFNLSIVHSIVLLEMFAFALLTL